MGFFGTFVLARPGGLLTDEAAVLGFGYQHEHLYHVGDGWQLLETRGVPDPPDFAAASERFVAATGTGVLAAYVNDSDCIGVYARTPDGWTTSSHLPAGLAQCGYRHRPQPEARTTAAIEADLERWARAVALSPVPEQIRTIAAYDDGNGLGWGHELPLDLLPALGLPPAGPPGPTTIDLDQQPWCSIVGFLGLARQAMNRRADRSGSPTDVGFYGPERPWERVALKVEADIWATRHRPDADTTTLRERAERLIEACRTEEKVIVPRWRT